MYEVEIKILDINREKTEEKLIALGARKVFDDEIHAIYFDYADNAIQKERGTFRLRKEGKRSVLTFKVHIEDRDAKIRDEKEVEISDFGTMRAILGSLGLSAWLEMRKHRTTYELNGTHFEFDKYHGEYEYIPEFLEIEAADVKTVQTCAKVLGFGVQDCKPWDAVQVAEHYADHKRNV